MKAQTNQLYSSPLAKLITQKNDTSQNIFSGGMNACQFGKIKLNNDTIEDLVIFDRSSQQLTTFLAENNRYIYHPEYQNFFPAINNWILVKDYNKDGFADIFTHTSAGVMVYKNTSTGNGIVTFNLIANPLLSQGFSGMINLQISSTDLPSIEDIDGDDDLDLICFNFYNGSQIEYHLNQQKELNSNADSLIFKRVDDCWGGIEEVSCGNINFGLNCATGLRKAQARINHVAASALLAIDIDGDGDKDLYETKESCNSIGILTNQGNLSNAKFNAIDTSFPDGKRRNEFPISSSQFYEDVTFDNIKDLIVSSNSPQNYLNTQNLSSNTLIYNNIGTNIKPIFQFKQSDFLQETMIDVGENSAPAFCDIDGDNDLDLIIGNRGKYDTVSKIFRSSLFVYQNVGNNKKPLYKLQTDDYLGLSKFNYTNIKPYFTDLNNDNAIDFVYTSNNSGIGIMNYYLNANSANQPVNFDINQTTQITDLSTSSTDNLCFADLNSDEWKDVLIGKPTGKIEYWIREANTFSYTLVTNNFGQKSNSIIRNYSTLAVIDFDKNGSDDLLVSDNSGYLYLYKNIHQIIQNNTIKTEDTIKINPSNFTNNHFSKIGNMPTLTIADIDNNNKPEFYFGNAAGGITALSDSLSNNLEINNLESTIKIYPNPNTEKTFTLESTLFTICDLYDLSGKLIIEQIEIPAFSKKELSFPQLSSGTYLIKVKSSVNTNVIRVVIL